VNVRNKAETWENLIHLKNANQLLKLKTRKKRVVALSICLLTEPNHGDADAASPGLVSHHTNIGVPTTLTKKIRLKQKMKVKKSALAINVLITEESRTSLRAEEHAWLGLLNHHTDIAEHHKNIQIKDWVATTTAEIQIWVQKPFGATQLIARRDGRNANH